MHCQLVALPDLPTAPLRAWEQSAREPRRCRLCELLVSERASGARWVEENAGFVALCPPQPRLPYETWVLPKRHNSHFEFAAHEDLADLANLTGIVLAKIARLSPALALNWWIQSGPFDSLTVDHYHWHIEIMPRMTVPAGFEWSSGWFINTVSPESAAARLRSIPLA